MDAFDPENDLIDQYLRGELSGKSLESFQERLKQDPELRGDVEFRKLLAMGISHYGSHELKNYIRQRTRHKKAMMISRKTWFYAAAAIGLVLVGSIAVIISTGKKPAVFSRTEVAKQEDKPATSTEDKSSAEGKAGTGIDNKSEPTAEAVPDSLYAVTDSDAPATEEAEVPEAVTIASNIPVIPIRIQPMTKEPETATRVPAARKTRNPEEDEVVMSQGKMDSIIAMKGGNMKPVYTSGEDDAARFRLSFLETRSGQPALSYKQGTNNQAEVSVYNLPYENPLVFSYQSRYYLKTGEKYYEINTNLSGVQPVKAVTDPALLKALAK